jgi:linoleoyl-CoA desaturase
MNPKREAPTSRSDGATTAPGSDRPTLAGTAISPMPRSPRPKYGADNVFHNELRRRVDAYFATTGQSQRDCWQMYLKTAILLAVFFGSYLLLVFVAQAWWQALPLAILLGLTAAGIGLNVQHDGGHHAYSNHAWVNNLMAVTLDLLGASSYLWHGKHVVFHHAYTNIEGQDTDIDLGFLGRLTPHQPRYRFHRWQHYYLWPFYGFMAIQWTLYNDFQEVITGRIHDHRFPRPRGWDLVTFIAGKAVFLTLAFGVPMLFHPWWVVLPFYGVAAFVLGLVLAVVFQLAHCVEEARFPLPESDSGRIENAWAVHQVETTVDFARRSHVVTWLLGGLNFQVEHHLFPRVCHIHYPALSKLVESTCQDFGVRYAEHRSFWSGMAAHFRWLRRLGMPGAAR